MKLPTSGDTAPAAFMLDMDGVLYHGNRVLPGAIEFMQALAGVPYVFVTNNPIRTPEQVADKLASLGFARPAPRQIITSGVATARWLNEQKEGFRFYAVGAPALEQVLSRYGVADAENADFVVVGEGEGLTFESLTRGINLVLQKGAQLVSTNPDANVDDERGVLPGGGALVAPFAVATGREPVTIGKPNPLLFEMALDVLGVPAEACVMVGDRPDTDIAGAKALGIGTLLVRTGRLAEGEPIPDESQRPHWDVANLEQARRLWGL